MTKIVLVKSFVVDTTARFLISYLLSSYIRPFNNPTETYRYYSLPFCQEHATEEEERRVAVEQNVALNGILKKEQKGALSHKLRMGESLVGDRRESSPYEVTFKDSVEWRLLCKKELGEDELKQLKKAIHNNYFFEMFVEDLPMWGYIGDVLGEDMIMEEFEGDSGKTFLFPHLHFYMGYNNDQIVSARVTTDVSRLRKFVLLVDVVLVFVVVCYLVKYIPDPFKNYCRWHVV